MPDSAYLDQDSAMKPKQSEHSKTRIARGHAHHAGGQHHSGSCLTKKSAEEFKLYLVESRGVSWRVAIDYTSRISRVESMLKSSLSESFEDSGLNETISQTEKCFEVSLGVMRDLRTAIRAYYRFKNDSVSSDKTHIVISRADRLARRQKLFKNNSNLTSDNR